MKLMGDQTETPTSSEETPKPLFPCSPRFVPSWCVRLDGGELGGGRTVYIDCVYMTKDALHYRDETSHFYHPEDGSREEQIEKHYQRARRDIEAMWGSGRPTYIVPPDFSTSPLAPGSWHSPRYRYFAWVSSTEMDGEKHGSHAFLIWWQEGGTDPDASRYEADCPSLVEAVERILKAVPWEEIAADFFI